MKEIPFLQGGRRLGQRQARALDTLIQSWIQGAGEYNRKKIRGNSGAQGFGIALKGIESRGYEKPIRLYCPWLDQGEFGP